MNTPYSIIYRTPHKTNNTDNMMTHKRDKKEYMRPEVAVILLQHEAHLLLGSSELREDIYIDDYEEEKNDIVFG